MTKFYAGIGSRETPPEILSLMTVIAENLKTRGYILRSGGALGADQAFHRGAISAAEIMIPWPKYNEATCPNIDDIAKSNVSNEAIEMASQFHPAWQRCTQGAKKLHGRNMHIMLGSNLREPVDFVICWTKDGLRTGGTGQALRLAESHSIPIYDLGVPEVLARARAKYQPE